MSTLPGQASKGEKTKPKFQSLDINSLYRVSRGENPEKQQQKSSLTYIKHGMQLLGKVPSARRAPANLPSLKAEHSGTDAAVPLVPPGAQGWGKQDTSQASSGASPAQQQQQQHQQPQQQQQMGTPTGQNSAGPQQQQLTSHQAAIALPVTTTIPPHSHKQLTPTAQVAPSGDKLWSTVMGGQEAPQPPLYQSPQFQHEFPSLSAGDGGPTRTGSDAPPYPSGLSLRPQTEGSWTQGGQRVGGAGGGGIEGGLRAPGPPGGPPQLPAQVGMQAGQQQPFPPQIRGVMPPFMCKGNAFQQQAPGLQNNMNTPSPVNGRGGANRPPPPRLADHRDIDEVTPRPIIREEELSMMDEIGKDMGWAESDEIDYNQKLAFSDDESEKPSKKDASRRQHHQLQMQQQHQIQQQQHQQQLQQQHQMQQQQQQHQVQQQQHQVQQQQQHQVQQQQQHQVQQQQQHPVQQQPQPHQVQQHAQQQQHQHPPQNRDHNREERNDAHPADSQQQQRQWSSSRSSTSRGRSSEDEDLWVQQRWSQTEKEVDMAVQRAKQRKEEEEKRFNEERKQGAAKKLLELEEKIQKRDRDNHEGVGTINPSSVPPKPINHVDIPLPDFQKEKERDRSHTPNEVVEEKNPPNNQGNSFRHLTQIEGKNFQRKHQKPSERERDRDREQGAPSFSRHFQNDLPPRFLKHQRNNSNSNLQTQQPYHQFDNRWMGGAQNAPPKSQQQQQNPPHNARNTRLDSPEVEKEGEVEDRREYKRQGSDDSYRSSHHSQDLQKMSETRFQDNVSSRNQSFDSQYSHREQDEDKWEVEKERELQPRQVSDMDWNDKRDKTRDEKPALPLERYDSNVRESRGDRPQRPDSRDSRSSRHQRDNEPQSHRDYIGQWSDPAPSSLSAHYDLPPPAPFEENKRREDRRAVPGPITKERIEADDARGEKRGLTQLKRGHAMETVRKEEVKETEVKKEQSIGAWADCIPSGGEEMEEKKLQDSHRSEQKSFMDQTKKSDDYSQNRNRPYSQKKGWGNVPNDYHSSRSQGWQKRSSSRGHKKSNKDYHTTDSDASVEDHTGEQKIEKLDSRDQKSPKPAKKLEKDEKNRENKQEKYVGEQKKFDKSERKDNYVPRGEPSRHGRGGGNFRSSRMSGLSKRIDGYGPPPSKSPFGHHDDKDKKFVNEDVQRVEAPAPVEDKTKQNQQALAAGIIGKRTNEPVSMFEDKNKGSRSKPDPRKPKSKGREDGCDMNSDHSDDRNKDLRKVQGKPQGSRPQQTMNRGRNNPPPRLGGDKRGSYENSRQNSSNAIKKDEKLMDPNVLANAIADISLKNRDEGGDTGDKEEKVSVNGDLEGFQEVKSKKMVKERQKSAEDKSATKGAMKSEPKELSKDRERKSKSAAQQLTQQQIQNIPPLMATPVNPPPVLPINNKNQFDRPRQSKLAPRFAKQKLQKAQMQQQHPSFCGDVNDMNKVNQNINASYVIKDGGGAPPQVSSCAWDKPLGSQLRNMEHDTMLGVAIDNVKVLDSSQTASQGTSPNNEKMLSKPTQLQEKALLDGTTPPVNTIIFENTNFKSAPGSRNSRNDKPRAKLEDPTMDSSVMAGFNKPTMNELLQNKNDGKSETIQLPLFKEDTADMKLDFFGTDLQFTDEKTAKNLCMSKSIHAITSGNNTVDSLDFKIASVKKVWETSEQEGEDNQISFGGPPLDSNVFNQGKDTPDDNHEGYSPSPNQTASTTTNVCKVKPTQQVSGSGQSVLSSSSHQQHSGIVAPGLMGNPLSPPPMPTVLGASVGIGPQQYAASHNIGYQAGLSGSTQYGISAIPSPPTVPLVYSQTQQLQAAAAQTASLYGAFQIDQSGVLGGQGRSQFSTYPNYHHHAASLGQTASSPYTTHQSVYLQTAPTHPPPPTAQPPPPPELYTGIGGYRLSAAAAAAPFAQSQQLNNPTTVLISSTSGNSSLMSAATVKGGSQAISAIGTKAGGVGQAYQQQPQSAAQQQQQQQQGQQQVYMAFDPSLQANYLAAAAAAAASPGAAMQRGPAAPVQNNVVAGLQPSSSYYSGSTGGQTGYFQQPGNSTMPSAQLQQHQAGYGLQGNVFGTHSQSHTNSGLQNYNSHFLTTSMQMAAALSAQQFRSAYMKGVGSQQIGDQSGRPQQLKSPSNQEVLSSVFNSGPQIPSPKSRQNCKHPPPQSSPTAQQKYNLYQGVGGQQNPNIQRYPTPIQRPVNFQQMQQNNNVNQKHRGNPNNKAPNRHYYGGQNNSLSVQNEKAEESKMNDGVLSNANSPNVTSKAAMGPNSTSNVNTSAEKVKDNKEETATLKD